MGASPSEGFQAGKGKQRHEPFHWPDYSVNFPYSVYFLLFSPFPSFPQSLLFPSISPYPSYTDGYSSVETAWLHFASPESSSKPKPVPAGSVAKVLVETA